LKGNPFVGAAYLLRGFSLILKPGIRRFVVIPLVINSLLFAALIWFSAGQFDHFMEWLLWPLFALTLSIVTFSTFIHVGNFIASPFNGLLAEAVERHLKGRSSEQDFILSRFLSSIWPALLSEFKKLSYFILRGGPLLLLFFIPVVNVAASFLWFIFSAWALVLEYSDYPMANHEILFTEQRGMLQKKRLTALGFGGAGLLILMVPILNFFVMPTAVAGATAMWVDQFEKPTSS